MKRFLVCLLVLAFGIPVLASSFDTRLVPIGPGWAQNKVNAVIFRWNAVISHDDYQVVAYYDAEARVVLAKRKLDETRWDIQPTQFSGNVRDAHNSISIMIDGAGYLHMSWDHHGHPLRYSRSLRPHSLEMSDKRPMTGIRENNVTYPEFYRLAEGDLLFVYRDGSSGRGNVMLNHYDTETRTWTQQQDSFIHGEDERNAYWQLCTDKNGSLHISWVWRETGDVATNHDLCYAVSHDNGKTWHRTSGEEYTLPITADTAEYAERIPQASELINTTSMIADDDGNPYIASYWTPQGSNVPQYHLVFHDGEQWHTQIITERETPFTLSGGGTRRIPISRCQILADSTGETLRGYLIFRDEERGSRVSVAVSDDLRSGEWTLHDLTTDSVGKWEPAYDTGLWKRKKELHLFHQYVGQGEGETLEDVPPQMVSILEWNP